jgi:hypothetical protein
MATFNKHNQFVEDTPHQVHDLSADTLKVALTNTAPVATNSILTDLTQITAENGYDAGGTAASITSSGQTSGTYKLVLADVVFTAANGTIGALRYADLYNDTPTSPLDPLIGWWDYGSSITLQDTETFTWDADATTGILTLA